MPILHLHLKDVLYATYLIAILSSLYTAHSFFRESIIPLLAMFFIIRLLQYFGREKDKRNFKSLSDLRKVINDGKQTLPGFKDGYITTRDGTRLYYQRCGYGPKIVFLSNGLGAREWMWWNFMQKAHHLLSEVTFISWDYRGMFASSAPPPGKLSVRDHTEDLLDLMNILGIDRAHCIIGWSTGVQVALQFAGMYGERVDRLVLMNGAHGHTLHSALQPIVMIPGLAEVLSMVCFFLRSVTSGWWDRVGSFIYSQETILRMITRVYAILYGNALLEWAPLLYFADAFSYQGVANSRHTHFTLQMFQELDAHSAFHLLPEIKTRTLIIGGFLDALTPIYHSFTMHARLPNSSLFIKMLGSHFTMFEFPDEVPNVILNFLAERVDNHYLTEQERITAWNQAVENEIILNELNSKNEEFLQNKESIEGQDQQNVVQQVPSSQINNPSNDDDDDFRLISNLKLQAKQFVKNQKYLSQVANFISTCYSSLPISSLLLVVVLMPFVYSASPFTISLLLLTKIILVSQQQKNKFFSKEALRTLQHEQRQKIKYSSLSPPQAFLSTSNSPQKRSKTPTSTHQLFTPPTTQVDEDINKSFNEEPNGMSENTSQENLQNLDPFDDKKEAPPGILHCVCTEREDIVKSTDFVSFASKIFKRIVSPLSFPPSPDVPPLPLQKVLSMSPHRLVSLFDSTQCQKRKKSTDKEALLTSITDARKAETPYLLAYSPRHTPALLFGSQHVSRSGLSGQAASAIRLLKQHQVHRMYRNQEKCRMGVCDCHLAKRVCLIGSSNKSTRNHLSEVLAKQQLQQHMESQKSMMMHGGTPIHDSKTAKSSKKAKKFTSAIDINTSDQIHDQSFRSDSLTKFSPLDQATCPKNNFFMSGTSSLSYPHREIFSPSSSSCSSLCGDGETPHKDGEDTRKFLNSPTHPSLQHHAHEEYTFWEDLGVIDHSCPDCIQKHAEGSWPAACFTCRKKTKKSSARRNRVCTRQQRQTSSDEMSTRSHMPSPFFLHHSSATYLEESHRKDKLYRRKHRNKRQQYVYRHDLYNQTHIYKQTYHQSLATGEVTDRSHTSYLPSIAHSTNDKLDTQKDDATSPCLTSCTSPPRQQIVDDIDEQHTLPALSLPISSRQTFAHPTATSLSMPTPSNENASALPKYQNVPVEHLFNSFDNDADSPRETTRPLIGQASKTVCASPPLSISTCDPHKDAFLSMGLTSSLSNQHASNHQATNTANKSSGFNSLSLSPLTMDLAEKTQNVLSFSSIESTSHIPVHVQNALSSGAQQDTFFHNMEDDLAEENDKPMSHLPSSHQIFSDSSLHKSNRANLLAASSLSSNSHFMSPPQSLTNASNYEKIVLHSPTNSRTQVVHSSLLLFANPGDATEVIPDRPPPPPHQNLQLPSLPYRLNGSVSSPSVLSNHQNADTLRNSSFSNCSSKHHKNVSANQSPYENRMSRGRGQGARSEKSIVINPTNNDNTSICSASQKNKSSQQQVSSPLSSKSSSASHFALKQQKQEHNKHFPPAVETRTSAASSSSSSPSVVSPLLLSAPRHDSLRQESGFRKEEIRDAEFGKEKEHFILEEQKQVTDSQNLKNINICDQTSDCELPANSSTELATVILVEAMSPPSALIQPTVIQ
eukprot:GDKJ01010653.1.p1 GENE.GDKJ01010653.1~~GDKJ01010653.1.p1  ORF type:complete len:1622 (-),score=388.44 GDKJ01010653.1:831-5696(-)